MKNLIRMKRNRDNSLIYCIVLACFFLMFASGCDKYARHEVLTFFFTGVPPIDGEEDLQSESSLSRGLTIEERREKKRIEAKRMVEEQKIPSYVHGPYASGQCYLCHSTASSATFRTFVKKRSGTKGTQMGGVSLRLVMEENKLCIDCHAEKSVDVAYGKGLWVHGPVSKGICTACHSPHQSPYEYMLLTGNSKDMCSKCHAEGFIEETEDHLRGDECTSCHNPHVGKSRFLLKKDFDETL